MRVPYLIWSGETLHTRSPTGWNARRRRPLIGATKAFLAYGPAAAEYLEALGAEPARTTVVGNGIDIDAFAERADEYGPAVRRCVRRLASRERWC